MFESLSELVCYSNHSWPDSEWAVRPKQWPQRGWENHKSADTPRNITWSHLIPCLLISIDYPNFAGSKLIKFKNKGPIFSPYKSAAICGCKFFNPPLTTAICHSLNPINSDKLPFSQVFPSIRPQPAFVISQSRQVACSWWKPYSRRLLDCRPPPPVCLLRQGKGPLNYMEVNSRRWQWDTVAGAPNGPLCRTNEFMKPKVSYLVDSSRGELPREPFDSRSVCGTFWFTSSSSTPSWCDTGRTNAKQISSFFGSFFQRRRSWRRGCGINLEECFFVVWQCWFPAAGCLCCACQALRRAFCDNVEGKHSYSFPSSYSENKTLYRDRSADKRRPRDSFQPAQPLSPVGVFYVSHIFRVVLTEGRS